MNEMGLIYKMKGGERGEIKERVSLGKFVLTSDKMVTKSFVVTKAFEEFKTASLRELTIIEHIGQWAES
jgi:hypothetical protein